MTNQPDDRRRLVAVTDVVNVSQTVLLFFFCFFLFSVHVEYTKCGGT